MTRARFRPFAWLAAAAALAAACVTEPVAYRPPASHWLHHAPYLDDEREIAAHDAALAALEREAALAHGDGARLLALHAKAAEEIRMTTARMRQVLARLGPASALYPDEPAGRSPMVSSHDLNALAGIVSDLERHAAYVPGSVIAEQAFADQDLIRYCVDARQWIEEFTTYAGFTSAPTATPTP